MARLAAFEAWIFASQGLMAAIAGAIRIRSVESHIYAHGIALPGPFQRMTFLIGTGSVAVSRQAFMVASHALH